MSEAIRLYVRWVDTFNRWVGRFAMRLIFVMAALMLYAIGSRLFFGAPVNWSMEMSQFLLVSYFLLGGPYSMQMGSHVRMDLFYSQLSARRRAATDVFTILFVMFYLGVLLWGGISSTEYAWSYNQKNYTSWAPPMWPVKAVMTFGIFLMLLQAISALFKDVAIARGKPIE
ncbi:TRAP transporter small permease subunit [Mesorhizobium sp. CAU 1741]|uniref:TRAP transporter small permease subunit n=1 Tax=Mesorhizobium sp. CAU 1741 TaxID=3140366 RepID=UPI00325B3760